MSDIGDISGIGKVSIPVADSQLPEQKSASPLPTDTSTGTLFNKVGTLDEFSFTTGMGNAPLQQDNTSNSPPVLGANGLPLPPADGPVLEMGFSPEVNAAVRRDIALARAPRVLQDMFNRSLLQAQNAFNDTRIYLDYQVSRLQNQDPDSPDFQQTMGSLRQQIQTAQTTMQFAPNQQAILDGQYYGDVQNNLRQLFEQATTDEARETADQYNQAIGDVVLTSMSNTSRSATTASLQLHAVSDRLTNMVEDQQRLGDGISNAVSLAGADFNNLIGDFYAQINEIQANVNTADPQQTLQGLQDLQRQVQNIRNVQPHAAEMALRIRETTQPFQDFLSDVQIASVSRRNTDRITDTLNTENEQLTRLSNTLNNMIRPAAANVIFQGATTEADALEDFRIRMFNNVYKPLFDSSADGLGAVDHFAANFVANVWTPLTGAGIDPRQQIQFNAYNALGRFLVDTQLTTNGRDMSLTENPNNPPGIFRGLTDRLRAEIARGRNAEGEARIQAANNVMGIMQEIDQEYNGFRGNINATVSGTSQLLQEAQELGGTFRNVLVTTAAIATAPFTGGASLLVAGATVANTTALTAIGLSLLNDVSAGRPIETVLQNAWQQGVVNFAGGFAGPIGGRALTAAFGRFTPSVFSRLAQQTATGRVVGTALIDGTQTAGAAFTSTVAANTSNQLIQGQFNPGQSIQMAANNATNPGTLILGMALGPIMRTSSGQNALLIDPLPAPPRLAPGTEAVSTSNTLSSNTVSSASASARGPINGTSEPVIGISGSAGEPTLSFPGVNAQASGTPIIRTSQGDIPLIPVVRGSAPAPLPVNRPTQPPTTNEPIIIRLFNPNAEPMPLPETPTIPNTPLSPPALPSTIPFVPLTPIPLIPVLPNIQSELLPNPLADPNRDPRMPVPPIEIPDEPPAQNPTVNPAQVPLEFPWATPNPNPPNLNPEPIQHPLEEPKDGPLPSFLPFILPDATPTENPFDTPNTMPDRPKVPNIQNSESPTPQATPASPNEGTSPSTSEENSGSSLLDQIVRSYNDGQALLNKIIDNYSPGQALLNGIIESYVPGQSTTQSAAEAPNLEPLREAGPNDSISGGAGTPPVQLEQVQVASTAPSDIQHLVQQANTALQLGIIDEGIDPSNLQGQCGFSTSIVGYLANLEGHSAQNLQNNDVQTQLFGKAIADNRPFQHAFNLVRSNDGRLYLVDLTVRQFIWPDGTIAEGKTSTGRNISNYPALQTLVQDGVIGATPENLGQYFSALNTSTQDNGNTMTQILRNNPQLMDSLPAQPLNFEFDQGEILPYLNQVLDFERVQEAPVAPGTNSALPAPMSREQENALLDQLEEGATPFTDLIRRNAPVSAEAIATLNSLQKTAATSGSDYVQRLFNNEIEGSLLTRSQGVQNQEQLTQLEQLASGLGVEYNGTSWYERARLTIELGGDLNLLASGDPVPQEAIDSFSKEFTALHLSDNQAGLQIYDQLVLNSLHSRGIRVQNEAQLNELDQLAASLGVRLTDMPNYDQVQGIAQGIYVRPGEYTVEGGAQIIVPPDASVNRLTFNTAEQAVRDMLQANDGTANIATVLVPTLRIMLRPLPANQSGATPDGIASPSTMTITMNSDHLDSPSERTVHEAGHILAYMTERLGQRVDRSPEVLRLAEDGRRSVLQSIEGLSSEQRQAILQDMARPPGEQQFLPIPGMAPQDVQYLYYDLSSEELFGNLFALYINSRATGTTDYRTLVQGNATNGEHLENFEPLYNHLVTNIFNNQTMWQNLQNAIRPNQETVPNIGALDEH